MTLAGRRIATAAVMISLMPLANAHVVSNISVPFSSDVIVPCANGGAGETVSLQGQVHLLFTLTQDRSGGVHAKIQTSAQGISGYGDTTGETYQAVGVENAQLTVRGPFPQSTTTASSFNVIGRRSGNNLMVHTVIHMTVNADGNVTVDNFFNSLSCR